MLHISRFMRSILEDIVGSEWFEYIKLGGSLDRETDTQSSFFDPETWILCITINLKLNDMFLIGDGV